MESLAASPSLSGAALASGKTDNLQRSSSSARADEKEWTVLVFCAGDNNLDRYFPAEHRELSLLNSLNRMNLLMQWDRGEKPICETPSWNGCRLISLSKGEDGRVEEKVISELGQVDMASPLTLRDFLVRGMKRYPSRHTMVVLKDHGHSWEGVLDDDSHKSRMSIQGLQDAFTEAAAEVGRKPDVIAFDACGMADAELLLALKDSAAYMAASEKVMYVPGFPYKEALSVAQGSDSLSVTPREMVTRLVRGAAGHPEQVDSFSAFELSKVDAFKKALDELSKSVALAGSDRKAIADMLRDHRRAFVFSNSMDLSGFLDDVEKSTALRSPELKEKAGALREALEDMTVDEFHQPETGAGGLSIANAYSVFNKTFLDTLVAQDTSWYQALTMAHSGPLAAGYAHLIKAGHRLSHLFSKKSH